MIQSTYDPKMHFDKSISDKLDEIVRKEGISQKEALERLVAEGRKTFEEADETRKSGHVIS